MSKDRDVVYYFLGMPIRRGATASAWRPSEVSKFRGPKPARKHGRKKKGSATVGFVVIAAATLALMSAVAVVLR